MHFFTLLITALVIIISANASITQKRSQYAFEVCRDKITSATATIKAIKDLTNNSPNFDWHPGYSGGSLSSANNVLFPKSAKYCCGTFAKAMSAKEANSISAFLPPIIDEYDALVSALAAKKPVIEKDTQRLSNGKLILTDTRDVISDLLTCLTSNGTPDKTALFNKYNNVNSNLKTAYGF